MCFYITSTLPKDTKLEGLKEVMDKFSMDFTPINNEFIKSQLRPGEIYIRATKSYCDCCTVLGSQSITPEFNKLLNSQKVRALRKKRWTDEQINLWILEKIKTKKPKGHKTLTPVEKDIELSNWNKFLTNLLNIHKISQVGILKHWYGKGLYNEEVLIKKTERVNVKDLSSKILLNLEENVLYEFHPNFKTKY